MSVMTIDSVNNILRFVQEKLTAKCKQTGIALAVSPEESKQDDEWLYVVVSPAVEGIRAYDYVTTLGEVERELRDEGVKNVLLVPAISN